MRRGGAKKGCQRRKEKWRIGLERRRGTKRERGNQRNGKEAIDRVEKRQKLK